MQKLFFLLIMIAALSSCQKSRLKVIETGQIIDLYVPNAEYYEAKDTLIVRNSRANWYLPEEFTAFTGYSKVECYPLNDSVVHCWKDYKTVLLQ